MHDSADTEKLTSRTDAGNPRWMGAQTQTAVTTTQITSTELPRNVTRSTRAEPRLGAVTSVSIHQLDTFRTEKQLRRHARLPFNTAPGGESADGRIQ